MFYNITYTGFPFDNGALKNMPYGILSFLLFPVRNTKTDWVWKTYLFLYTIIHSWILISSSIFKTSSFIFRC